MQQQSVEVSVDGSGDTVDKYLNYYSCTSYLLHSAPKARKKELMNSPVFATSKEVYFWISDPGQQC